MTNDVSFLSALVITYFRYITKVGTLPTDRCMHQIKLFYSYRQTTNLVLMDEAKYSVVLLTLP